jgi:hypothetical protein
MQPLRQTPAGRRVRRADNDVTSDDEVIDTLAHDVIEGGLKGRKVAVDVGQDGDTHAIANSLFLIPLMVIGRGLIGATDLRSVRVDGLSGEGGSMRSTRLLDRAPTAVAI